MDYGNHIDEWSACSSRDFKATYNQIKLLPAACIDHWKEEYFISFEEYILEYLNIIMIDIDTLAKYQRLKIKK